MSVGGRPKVMLGLVVLFVAVAYVVIVDLGINAGRIHRGVEVAGLEVGGLTPDEAEARLRERADDLSYSILTFSKADIDCRFTPLELGWDPRPGDTAAAAQAVGRRDGVFRALEERARSWIFGTKVHWRSSFDQDKLSKAITACERLGLASDLQVDGGKLRRRITQAVVSWPRRTFGVPVLSGELESPDG